MNIKKILIVIIWFNLICSSFCQWIQYSTGLGSDKYIYSLANIENNIIAGLSNYPSGFGGAYVSTNNGQTWSQTLNNRMVYCLATLGDYIFAGTHTYYYPSGIFFTTNNGQNWTQTTMNDEEVFSLAISENKIYAGTLNNGVFFSTNFGLNWIQTALNDKDIYSLAISGNNVYAGTFYHSIYVSTDNGVNWSQRLLYNESNIYSIAVSGNNIYAGTNGNGVYISTNNGLNWSQTALNHQEIRTIVIYGDYVFAGSIENGVYLSTNNGLTWSQKNEGWNSIPPINTLHIANNYIFAGTRYSSVWRRQLQEVVGIKNISISLPLIFSLSQNYPNPFNPQTKIKFSIPLSRGVTAEGGRGVFVSLIIYDLLGREVTTLVNEELKPGTYEADWDGSGYSSGVYFYKLVVGDPWTTAEAVNSSGRGFVETKKMVLMK